MTEALFIFAYVVGSFAIGIRVGRHINEGQRPPLTSDDAYGDGLTAADFKRVHSTCVTEGSPHNHG